MIPLFLVQIHIVLTAIVVDILRESLFLLLIGFDLIQYLH